MGRKEIAEAAGASNRFLDRPVKAIDSDTGIGADLTQLRTTVEELDPKRNGALSPYSSRWSGGEAARKANSERAASSCCSRTVRPSG